MRTRSLSFILLAFGVLVTEVPLLRGQNSKENADFKLAVNLFNDGLYDLAAEQLKQFIASYPSTTQGIDARFTLGLAQLKLKRFDDARLTFQTFALSYQDNPKAPEAWWNVGEAYAALHNDKEAALAYERVKVFHPRSRLAADALLTAARFFLLAGERDNARKSLRVILQEYPSSGAVLAARTRLGQMYFEEGNLEQAQSELKRVIDGDPSADARAGALLLLGTIAQSTGRADQAETNYREIIAKYGASAAVQGAHVNLGKLLAAGGKPAEALEAFSRALSGRMTTDSSFLLEALEGKADAQSSLKDYAAAAGSYERCLAAGTRNMDTPQLLWKLAYAAARAKNYRKSNDACLRLLKSDAPDLVKSRARILLARNAEEQKNIPLAVQHYEAFVEGHPEDPAAPEILFHIGELSVDGLRDYRKGASVYESLAARYPSSPSADDALAGAARTFEALKDYDRALRVYRDLLARYPSTDFRPDAEERMRVIETFEAKEKDAGVEKLALLVGDVVAEKTRSSLAYRLGEIYFNDLKNYSAAVAQFENALADGLPQERAADAAFMKARSLEFLSWKDPRLQKDAAEAYAAFLAGAPASPRRDDALLALFRLSATSLSAARQAAAPLLAPAARLERKDLVLMTLGELLEAADSLAAAHAAYGQAGAITRDPSTAGEAAFRRFRLLVRENLADSALAEGRRLCEGLPTGARTAEILSMTAGMEEPEHPHKAAEKWQRLANEFPYTRAALPARRRLADALAAAGERDGAIAAYTELTERQIADPLTDGTPEVGLLLALGRVHATAGDSKQARRYLTAVVRRERTGPIAGETFALLAQLARDEGARDAATAYYRQAEAAAPGTQVSRDIADLLFESGDYRDAITHYRQLAQAASGDTDRQYFDARIIVAGLRIDDATAAEKEAAVFVKRYRNTREDQALFELERGNRAFRREDYAGAMKSFRRVADTYDDSPSAPDAMYWIGKSFEAMDKRDDAIKQLEQLLATFPHAPVSRRAQLALGNLYYAAEQWNEAIKRYRVIVDDPNPDPALLPSAMSNLIETYDVAGAFDGALSLTRKYLERFPNSEDALDKKIRIGILYTKLGYYDQAGLHLQSLLDEAGSDLEGEIRYYIAEANYSKGDYQQAILDFLKVPYLVTKKGKIDWTANSLYMSGQSYEKMGRFDQALTMYQQIVDRTGIDATFKAAARKEIDRVKTVLQRKTN